MIYETTYDLIKFGDYLLSARKKNKLTQTKVRDICGLNPDTLRKLEAGITIPTIDTLKKISEVYHIDALKLLESCKYSNNEILNNIKSKIDFASYSDNDDDLLEISSELKHIAKTMENYPSCKLLILQLDYLMQVIRIKNKKDKTSIQMCKHLSYDALRLTKSFIGVHNLENYLYTPLEIRFLLAIAIASSRSNMTRDAIRICQIALDSIEAHKSNATAYLSIKLQVYYSLSHFYFLLNENEEVLHICDIGIELSRKSFMIKFLPYFFFRKGISEYMMNNKYYRDSLLFSINAFELLGLREIGEYHLNIIREKYNINLD